MPMDELKIGDFSQPLAKQFTPPKPEPTAPAPITSPAAEKLNAAETTLETQARETEEVLQPKINYEEQLKAHGISREEAAKIVDDVLFKGYYAEEIPISQRIKVVFRTRQARDTARTLQYLEIAKPIYENHYNEIVGKYSLAAALERLGRDKFEYPPKDASIDKVEEAFQTRLSYINALPDPILRLLFLKVSKFDEKVRVVLQEGAIENF